MLITIEAIKGLYIVHIFTWPTLKIAQHEKSVKNYFTGCRVTYSRRIWRIILLSKISLTKSGAGT